MKSITPASRTEQKRPKFWLGWFLLLFLGMAVVFLLLAPRMLPPSYAKGDFIQFWSAGRMNWLGLDPYSTTQWGQLRHDLGSDWLLDPVFNYPLPLYRILAPLGLLGLYPAYLVWDVLTLFYLALLLVLVVRQYRVPNPAWLLLPLMAGALLFRPVIVTLRNGQITGLVFFLCGLAAFLVEMRKPFLAGVVLAFCMLKPQLGFGLLAFFTVWMLARRQWWFLGGAAAAGGLLWLVGFQAEPAWVSIFLGESAAKVDIYSSSSTTLWGLMGLLLGEQSILRYAAAGFLTAFLTVALFVLLLKWGKSLPAFTVMGLIIPVALLISPYGWTYDQILLLIPIWVLACLMITNGYPYLLSAGLTLWFSILSILSLVVAMVYNKDSLAALIPISVFLLMIVVLRRLQAARPVSSRV